MSEKSQSRAETILDTSKTLQKLGNVTKLTSDKASGLKETFVL